MASLRSKKLKIALGVLAGLAVLGGIYLNRAYSYIYSEIGKAALTPAEGVGSLIINDNMRDTGTLVYAALGDSLTAGTGAVSPEDSLPYLLAEKLGGSQKRLVVQNFAVPGFKTADLISQSLEAAISSQPDIVTLLIGANDIHNQVSPADFKRNYDLILKRLSTETKAKIYLIGIPFIGANSMMLPPYQYYYDAETRKFNAIIKELSARYQVAYIDLYTPTVKQFKRPGEHYSADSFHPSALGYKIWADIIYASFNK